jgi:predicted dehydrogenase
MCRNDTVDAVFVGTPNQLHASVGLAAVRAGKHVLVIKPLADSVASARQLVEEAEAAGVTNMMSLSMRFGSDCVHLGRKRDRGAFGEIYYGRARSVRRSGIPGWNPGFLRAGGGAFRDMGIHVLDTAWWLMDMPAPVSAFGVSGAKFGPRGEGYFHFEPASKETAAQFAADDYTCGLVRFENGAALQVESFWASHQPSELQVELFGTEAGARLFPPTVYGTEDGAPHDTSIEAPPKAPTGWERIADHFIKCALDGAPCSAPLRHGLRVQQMLEAVLESAADGREKRL